MNEKVIANLHGTLLIAAPKWSQGKFATLASGLHFPNEYNGTTVVDVVALGCMTKEEIPGFITSLKEDLERCEKQTPTVQNSIRWCEDMIKLLADPVYTKKLPPLVKQNVEENLHHVPCVETISIFLCGCTYINK